MSNENAVILDTLLTMGIVRYWPDHPTKAETIRNIARRNMRNVTGKNVVLLNKVHRQSNDEQLIKFVDTAVARLEQGGHLST